MKRIVGRVTIVQEQRFRLRTDGGQSYLFTLARDATVAAHLRDLLGGRTRVAVEFEGEPGLASGVAHKVQRV